MSLTIHKYPVEQRYPEFDISMHVGAQILSVQIQDHAPYLWVVQDTALVRCRRMFLLLHEDSRASNTVRESTFVGTFQQDGLAYHLFDLGEIYP